VVSRRPFAVLLAGGLGTRLAPYSTPHRPKQVLPLLPDGRSPLRATWDRLSGLIPADQVLVVTGRPMAKAIAAELPDLPAGGLLIEPDARNTLPALTWAAAEVRRRGGEILISMHADHHIDSDEAFALTLRRATQATSRNKLVLVGLSPSHPDPNLGWIVPGPMTQGVGRVRDFVEKPTQSDANALMASGALWNLGLFAWRVSAFDLALRTHAKDHAAGYDKLVLGHAVEQIYPALPRQSVDRGLVEHLAHSLVVKAEFGWSDLGTWERLLAVSPHLASEAGLAPALPGER
jgi:mannose-1-phosphate guanylyltransferase